MATTTKAKETVQETENLVNEMSNQAFKNWEKAFQSGIKIQEQAVKWMGESLSSVSAAQDWQKRMIHMGSLASGLIPQMQRQAEQAMDLVGQNTKAATDIWQKTVDAAQTPIIPEKDSKWMDVWTTSMRAIRQNAEAVMEMNNQAFTAWVQAVRKNETAENRAKAA